MLHIYKIFGSARLNFQCLSFQWDLKPQTLVQLSLSLVYTHPGRPPFPVLYNDKEEEEQEDQEDQEEVILLLKYLS